MSTADKPDSDRAARFFANLVIDGEAERMENLSDEEYIAEVKRKGGDPSDEMSVEDLLERVRTLAAQRGAAAAPSPGTPAPGAATERTVLPESPAPPERSAAPKAPAAAGRRVVPLRRRAPVVWWAAAASVAAIIGTAAIEGPAIVASFRKPTPREKAEMMRDGAIGKCAEGSWEPCRQLLDEAGRLDPAGESEERVQKAREAIEKGEHPGPRVP